MTGARVSVEPNSDKACFFTYVCQFSRKNIEVEFRPKISDNIPIYDSKILFLSDAVKVLSDSEALEDIRW